MSEPLDTNTLKREVGYYICQNKCFGRENNAAACCQLGERDFIMGPITDASAFLKRLNARAENKYSFDEVFIEFKEGSRLFPQKSTWQNVDHYPALRVDLGQAALPCRFLNDRKECGIYDLRPQICRNYQCEHLKNVLSLL
jgi:Fe-S-cluster containining protein